MNGFPGHFTIKKIILYLVVGVFLGLTTGFLLRLERKLQLNKVSEDVLAAHDIVPYTLFKSNLKYVLNNSAEILKGLTVSGDIEAPGSNLNLDDGEITASNIIYSITAGSGIAITGGQNPTISLANPVSAGVTSIESITGAVDLAAGNNITLSTDGSKITISSSGGSTTDTNTTYSAGTGLTLNDTTFSVNFAGIGLQDTGTSTTSGASVIGVYSGNFINIAVATPGSDLQTVLEAIDDELSVSGGGGIAAVGNITSGPAFTLAFPGSNLFVADTGWIGLGSGAARIYFDDSGTDTISFLGANVGIGLSNPSYTLDVAGNIRAGTDFYLGSIALGQTGGASVLGVNSSSITYSSASNIQQVLEDLDSAINNFGVGGSGPWLISGSYAYLNPSLATYLGNPTGGGTNKLSGAYFSDGSVVSLGTDNDYRMLFNGTNFILGDTANTFLTIGDSGTTGNFNFNQNQFYLRGDGNVGIGTTAPIAALDVNGNINVSNNYQIGGTTVLSVNSTNIRVGMYAGATIPSGISGLTLLGYEAGGAINNTNAIQNTLIGAYAGSDITSGATNTLIGYNAGWGITTGYDNVAIGDDIYIENNSHGNTILGHSVDSQGSYNSIVGAYSNAGVGGSFSVAIGYDIDLDFSGSIGIGANADPTAANQLVIGGNSGDGYINDAYFGRGVVSATPNTITLNATGGSGSNIDGANFRFAGGKATGNADGGDLVFLTSDTAASGSTLQSLTEKMRLTDEGQLGIGTSSPTAGMALDVVGNIRAGTELFMGSIGLNDTGTSNSTSGASQIGVYYPELTYSTSTNVQDVLDDIDAAISTIASGTSVAWTDAGTYLYPTAGEFLGNPAGAGSNKLAGGYFVDNAVVSLGTDNDYRMLFDGTNFILGDTANSFLSIGDSGTTGNFNFNSNQMYLRGDGNLGLGTTNPTEKFSLVGNFSQQFSSSLTLAGTYPFSQYISDIKVKNNVAYIVGEGIGDTGGVLKILDVSRSQIPSLISSTTLPNPVASVDISSNYAYVVTDESGVSDEDLHILDISNKSRPAVVGNLELNITTVNNIFVTGRYAFIASGDSKDLIIVDISNPKQPLEVSSLNVAGFSITELYVQGKYVYAVVSTSAGGQPNFIVIDISNINVPVVADSLILSTDPSGVYISGRYAYLPRNSLLTIVDIANQTDISTVSDTSLGSIGYEVEVHGKYAYVITADSAAEIKVYDISNPLAPVKVSEYNRADPMYTFTVEGKYLYGLDGNNTVVYIYELTGSDLPTATIGALAAGNLNVLDNGYVGNNFYVQNALNVGQGGAEFLGNVGIGVSSTQTALVIAQNGSGDILNLFDGANKVFTVVDGGAVGIGMTSPTSGMTLDVAGNIRAGTDVYIGSIALGGTAGATKIGFNPAGLSYIGTGSTTVQTAITSLDSAIGNVLVGSSGIWRDSNGATAGGMVYIGDTSSTLAVGGTTTSAPLYFSPSFGLNLNVGSTGAFTIGDTTNDIFTFSTDYNSGLDLFKINIPSGTSNLANIFAIYDNGSAVFKVSSSQIESAVPHTFTAAGDVSIAYDLNFTNTTAANIDFAGPGNIRTVDPSLDLDLTLTAANAGVVYVDDNAVVAGSLMIGATYAGLGVTAPQNSLIVQGAVGIGTTTITSNMALDVAGNIRAGTDVYVGSIALGGTAGGTKIGVNTNAFTYVGIGNSTVQLALDDLDAALGNLLIGQSGMWLDGGEYTYLNTALTSGMIGNPVSAGANKMSAMYLTDTAPLVFGLDNDFYMQFNGTNLTIGDTTNTFLAVGDSGTTGNFNFNNNQMYLRGDGNLGLGTTAPGALFSMASGSTSTSFTGFNLTWDTVGNGTSEIFSTGDLFKIDVGQYANPENLFAIYDNGSDVFKVSQSQIESAVPHSFTSAGDVSMAYDLIFTNQTSSNIQSYGPLTIESGEAFENLDLTLRTYGSGDIVLDVGTSGSTFLQGYDPSIIFDSKSATDTDFWSGVVEDSDGVDDDLFIIGDGNTPGLSSALLSINTSGNVGIGTTSITPDGDFTPKLVVANPSDSTEWVGIGYNHTGDFGYLYAVDSGAAWKDLILQGQGGNIGLGLTNPAARLDIDALSNTTGLRLRGLAENTEIADIYVAANGQLYISNANTAGTEGHIDIDPNDQNYGFLLRDSTTPGLDSIYTNFYTKDSATDYLNILVNAATSTSAGLFIDDDDQVGIGTSNPNSALSVIHTSGTGGVVIGTTNYQGAGFSAPAGGLRVEGSVMIGTTAGGGLANTSGKLRVGGGAIIGATYAGFTGATSPDNGMLIQGRVAIGTSLPATSATLDVAGELQITLDGNLVGTEALCGNQADGDVADTADVTISDCSTTVTADYMEMYATENDVEMGDLLASGDTYVTTTQGDRVVKLKKSSQPYQKNIIGIASNPDEAGDFNSIGHNIKDEDRPFPVALNGRVKVKVSSENGNIEIGDYVTASTISGKAMKATEKGIVIGQALESWNPGMGTDRVMVFVKNMYYDPSGAQIADDFQINTGPDGYELENLTTGNVVSQLAAFDTGYFGILNAGEINADDINLSGVDLASSISGINTQLSNVQNDISFLADVPDWQTDIDNKLNDHETRITALEGSVKDALNRIDLMQPVASEEADISSLTDRVSFLEKMLFGKQASESATLAQSDSEEVLGVSSEVLENLTVTGKTNLFDLGIVGDISAGQIVVRGKDAEINSLALPLALQSEATAPVEIMAGKVVIDTDGNLTVKETVKAKQFEVDKSDIKSASAGIIKIKAGEVKIKINTTAISSSSLIFATPISTPVTVATKIAGQNSFEIVLEKPLEDDLEVNWWIVN